MPSDEQRQLATTIKNIHRRLRNRSKDVGAEEAWREHLNDEATLKVYAKSMRELAEKHWKQNASEDDRIDWTVNFCEKYFQSDELERRKQKELRTIKQLGEEEIVIEAVDETFGGKLEALDVGSSGNFFKTYERFNMLPIDISPSDNSVLFCDFLSVPIEDRIIRDESTVTALPSSHFHVVIFSLLLEYLPSSDQRIRCCEKALQVLKTNGILIIITPDSNHHMKNSKQIKNWQWTLAKIGFQRVKVEKLKNLTCMTFRKGLTTEIPQRWAESHKEAYIEFKLEIPQDKVATKEQLHEVATKIKFDVDLMNELPFE